MGHPEGLSLGDMHEHGVACEELAAVELSGSTRAVQE